MPHPGPFRLAAGKVLGSSQSMNTQKSIRGSKIATFSATRVAVSGIQYQLESDERGKIPQLDLTD